MSRAVANAQGTVHAPSLDRPLEHLFDRQGRAEFGWIQTNVLYLRLDGIISVSLGEQYAARMGRLLESASQAYVFLDSSRLRSCELLAKSAIVRAFMQNRPRLARVVITSAPEVRHSHGPCMLAALEELVQYVNKPTLERWLLALAPFAPGKVDGLSTPDPGATHSSFSPGQSAIRSNRRVRIPV